jgi:hypothetical protein
LQINVSCRKANYASGAEQNDKLFSYLFLNIHPKVKIKAIPVTGCEGQ